MPNRRWEIVLIDAAGQKIAHSLDTDEENAKNLADTWNAIRDHWLPNVKKRPSQWVAQPKEPTHWNPR